MACSDRLLECSICLDLLKDPVTTSCGHSYCMKCINDTWDKTQKNGEYSCPQCREIFSLRPDLRRNTLLAAVVDEHMTISSQRSAAEAAEAAENAGTFAEHGDIKCDVCTGRKRKASKFCSRCLTSYCDTHLTPHFVAPALKKHKLSAAEDSAKIQESICGRHNKLLKHFCRTDEQLICRQCVAEGHRGHEIVTIEEEKREIQRRVDWTKEEIADRLLDSEGKMEELRQAAASIKGAAWEVCDEFEQICANNIRLYVRSVEMKCFEMREKIGKAEKDGVDWTNCHLQELQREVLKLRRRGEKVDQLSQIEDQIQLLKGFQALGEFPAVTDLHKSLDMLANFADVQQEKMKSMCNKAKKELISHSDKNEIVSRGPRLHETITSKELALIRSKKTKVEVDPNTVAACLCLSASNKEISWSSQDQSHPDHPDRFTYFHQALGKTGLTGSHYWEVEWDGGIVDLAVSYRSIKRKGSGNDCCFGHNEISWKLTCTSSGCTFWHNQLHKGQIPPPVSPRVGVHLQFEAGKLAFYSFLDDGRVTLLHEVQTTFTEPLYPGFSVDSGSTLRICNTRTRVKMPKRRRMNQE